MKKMILASAIAFAASAVSATDIDVAMYDESVKWQQTDVHVAMYDEAYPSYSDIQIESLNAAPATAAGIKAFDPYNDDNCDG